jgi:sucrose-6-phosphate hydrolase SacC (GH32 family)
MKVTTSREIYIQNRYLNLPVKKDSPVCRMKFLVNGEPVRVFDIEFARETPDFWVFADVTSFKGQYLSIQAECLDPPPQLFESIVQSDTIIDSENLYQEKHRPQFHFSSRRGWINDPNGLVYHEGEYHLFYQHNPYGVKWGNMHWGHAVSADLVHWRELPDALYPDEMGTMFSGSAVVDWGDTSSLKRGKFNTLVCLYTAAGNQVEPEVPYTQCMAYSHDLGYTWIKYPGNPVLDHITDENRDPKVIWHGPSAQWIMVLYLEEDDRGQRFGFFNSPDLKGWAFLHDLYLPGSGECPDFFPLQVDGVPGQDKWIFWAADGVYLVGDFNGQTFTPETDPIYAYYGGDGQQGSAYAAQTWSDVTDGRRIQIPWLRGDIPGMPFNQQMGFPVELTLRATEAGPRLHFSPVKEITSLVKDRKVLRDVTISEHPVELPVRNWGLLDLHVEVDVGKADALEFHLHGVPMVYDVGQEELKCCDLTARVELQDRRLQFRLLLDRASLEIFAADGLVYMPFVRTPEDGHPVCSYFSRGGKAEALVIEITHLASIWR